MIPCAPRGRPACSDRLDPRRNRTTWPNPRRRRGISQRRILDNAAGRTMIRAVLSVPIPTDRARRKMRSRSLRLNVLGAAALAAAAWATPRPAVAAPMAVGVGAFSGVDITFDGMASDSPIGAQVSPGDGVTATFSSGLTANNLHGPGFFGDADTIAANFATENSGTTVGNNPITVDFSSPIVRIGFVAATAPSTGLSV